MILSDDHRLAFIHIPKCAGVSVKQPLRAIDSTGGAFSRIGDHPALGRIHYAHIILRDLAEHFPEEWDKLRAYQSFAVVRDPTERFVSAMFQRLREFRGANQSDITADRFAREADAVVRYLEAAPERLDLEHVHFNRQADYLQVDGKSVVKHVFAIENMDAIRSFIELSAGIRIEEERQNRSTEIRFSSFKPIIRMLRAPYAAIVPYAARNRVRSRLLRAGLYADAAKRPLIRSGSRLEGFIRNYYAQDFEIHVAHR